MNRLFVILFAYHLTGVAAIAWINRRKQDRETGARWTKLLLYIFITATLLGLLCFVPRLAVGAAVLIALTGLYELVRLPRLRLYARLGIGLLYGVPALLFCLFAARAAFSGAPAVTYLLVLTFDGFSQVAGQLLGGPKMVPRISPGKTYAGFFGGLLMALATAALQAPDRWPRMMLMAAGVSLLAFAGDLLASLVKRRAGVKDYSNLIPGHGGVLDRFDSFLFAGAVLEAYFRLT